MAFKSKATLRMLALEAPSVNVARTAVRSLLTDMGVESALWTLPSFTDEGKTFPRCMPLGDLDHMMHHVMSDGEAAFASNNDMWTVFERQINGLAKFFSKKDACERFVQKFINENPKIPAYSKKALGSMFDRTCPTYCKTRWHFAFEVLHWLSSREQLLQYLEPGAVSAIDDISSSEVDALKELYQGDAQQKFWSLFWAFYILQKWGFSVHTYTHACPCPEHQDLTKEDRKRILKSPCALNGRRMINLACGACSAFHDDLKVLRLQDHPRAFSALTSLGHIDPEGARQVEHSFSSAKSAMMLRFSQGTSCYEQFPWNICRLLSFLLVSGQDRHTAIQQSRDFARELIQLYRDNKLQRNTFASIIFEGRLRRALIEWSTGTEIMCKNLFHELLSYSMALVVMQRLESRHHLVNQQMCPSRASSAAYVSANLRRKLNGDCFQASYRQHFEAYLQRFDELVEEPWNTKCELHKLVSGHTLQLMFADTSVENAIIAAQSVKPAARAHMALRYQEHLQMALIEGEYYAFPANIHNGDTTYLLCQVVNVKPDAKRYIQRVVGWNTSDHWVDQVGVLILGSRVAYNWDVDADASCLTPLPADSSFEVQVSGDIEGIPMDTFFKFDFDHVYHFATSKYVCRLSTDTITASMEEDSIADVVDVASM